MLITMGYTSSKFFIVFDPTVTGSITMQRNYSIILLSCYACYKFAQLQSINFVRSQSFCTLMSHLSSLKQESKSFCQIFSSFSTPLNDILAALEIIPLCNEQDTLLLLDHNSSLPFSNFFFFTKPAFQYLKGDEKKDGQRLFTRAYSDRKKRNCFKLRVIQVRYQAEILYYEGSEALEQVALTSCRRPPPLEVLKAMLFGALRKCLVKGLPDRNRRIGMRYSLRSLPTQIIL